MNGLINFSGILVAVLLITLLINRTKLRKLPEIHAKINNLVVPTKNDVLYSELNLESPRVVCKTTPSYTTNTLIKIDSAVPITDHFEVNSEGLTCNLVLNNEGYLDYFINSLKVWTSKNPRNIVQSTELSTLNNYAADEGEWNHVYENANYKLHVMPLAITSKLTNQIIWTFSSGWSSDFANFRADFELPTTALIGNAILISKNRKFRCSLLDSSDVLILETSAENENKYVRGIKFHQSLIESFCNI